MPIEFPIDWGADPFHSRSWRFRLSAMYFLNPYLQLFEESSKLEPLLFAKRVFLDWIDYNLVRDKKNDFRWYDQATGLRAAYLGYVIDRLLRRDALTGPELKKFLWAASAHVAHLRDPDELATNNHALYQLAGLSGLCRALPELTRCNGAEEYSDRSFARIIESQFGPDAIHTENSPFYHGYALSTIQRIVAAGWLHVFPADKARLDRALENLAWLVRPDGKFAQIGDSHGRPSKSLLLKTMPIPGRGAPALKVFPAAGYAVVRSPTVGGPKKDGYLFLTAGYQSLAHKHWDALSFEWFDGGRSILVDSGMYGTNRDQRRSYVRSTRAHNTVEIDGEDSDGDKIGPPESLAAARLGEVFAVAAEVIHPKSHTHHRRVILYEPGRWLLVHDEVRSTQRHQYTAWFHLPPQAKTSRAGDGELHTLLGRKLVRIVDLRHGDHVVLLRGQRVPRLQGWVTKGNGILVPNDTIGYTQNGVNASFDVLFIVDGSTGALPALQDDKIRQPGEIADLCWSSGENLLGARVRLKAGILRLYPCSGSEPHLPPP